MSAGSWRLSVDRSEFARALKLVGRAGQDVHSANAMLAFKGGQLVIELLGNAARVAAAGHWPGELRAPGGALERLARSLPDENPLELGVEGGRLHVARFSIPCEVRNLPGSTAAGELIPPDADLFEILKARFRCSAEEIDAAGATGLVAKAEREIDEKCQAAARGLQRYGVTPAHLRKLCDEHASEGTRKFRESDGAAIRQIARAWELLAPFGVEPDELKVLMDNCLRNAWGPGKP